MRRRTKKNVMTETLFVQLTLDKKVLKSLKKKLKESEEQEIIKGYPYFTFKALETLFGKLKKIFQEEFPVERVALARLDAKGKPTTEDELDMEHFKLDEDYENILKPLSEALFNDSKFSSLQFEDKIDYLENTVFPVYQESTELDALHLPVLPEFLDEDFMACPIPFYENHVQSMNFEENQDIPEVVDVSTEVNSEQEDYGDEDVGKAPHPLQHEAMDNESHKNVDKHQHNHEEEDKYKYPHEYVDRGSNVPNRNTEGVRNSLSPISLTLFDQISFQTLEAYHPRFVENELARERVSLNQEIKRLDHELQALQQNIFANKQKQLEKECNLKLQTLLASKDQRGGLKVAIMHDGQVQFSKDLRLLRQEKLSEKQFQLEEAKLAYERQVAEIHSTFDKAVRVDEEALKKRTFETLEENYRRTYRQETERLNHLLFEEKRRLQDEQNQVMTQLLETVSQMVHNKDEALREIYHERLSQREEELRSQHLEAKREKQAQDKLEAVQHLTLQVEEFKEQMAQPQEKGIPQGVFGKPPDSEGFVSQKVTSMGDYVDQTPYKDVAQDEYEQDVHQSSEEGKSSSVKSKNWRSNLGTAAVIFLLVSVTMAGSFFLFNTLTF
jgi:hypothetical protein